MCPCEKRPLAFCPFCMHARCRGVRAQSPSVAPLALHAGPAGATECAELGTVVHVHVRTAPDQRVRCGSRPAEAVRRSAVCVRARSKATWWSRA